jgi:hypothetical protein
LRLQISRLRFSNFAQHMPYRGVPIALKVSAFNR